MEHERHASQVSERQLHPRAGALRRTSPRRALTVSGVGADLGERRDVVEQRLALVGEVEHGAQDRLGLHRRAAVLAQLPQHVLQNGRLSGPALAWWTTPAV